MDAHAGASRTVSPGRARSAAVATTTSMTASIDAQSPVSATSTSTTGTSGACRASAACDHVAVEADEHGGAQPRRVRAHQLVELRRRALGQPAGDPDDVLEAAQRGGGGVRVGRLGVVDPGHAVRPRRPGRAGAGRGGRPRSPFRTAIGGTPCARASAAAARAFATTCGARTRASPGDVVQRGELGGRRPALLHERPVGEHLVDEPDHRHAGMPRVKPIARQPSIDVGVAHELLGDRVGDVVDAGDLGVLVDPALVAGVASRLPCQSRWSGATLRQARARGAHRRRRVQLEAGQLHGEHVVRLRVQHGLEHRRPDVADGGGAEAGRGEHRGEHLHGGRLAVGAGDGEPGGGAGRGPHAARPARPRSRPGRRRRRRPASTGCVGPPAGRGDDERRARARPASGRRRRPPAPSRTSAPRVSRIDGPLALVLPVARRRGRRPAPRARARASAAAKPEIADAGDDDAQPRPVRRRTTVRASSRRRSLTDHPLRVEDAEAERRRTARR